MTRNLQSLEGGQIAKPKVRSKLQKASSFVSYLIYGTQLEPILTSVLAVEIAPNEPDMTFFALLVNRTFFK